MFIGGGLLVTGPAFNTSSVRCASAGETTMNLSAITGAVQPPMPDPTLPMPSPSPSPTPTPAPEPMPMPPGPIPIPVIPDRPVSRAGFRGASV